ncbi:MAG: hypothetical protein JST21_00850 [Bacteroidetes bacterium]|nr:hypothetical protein [Bacteroidota bacterium]
MSFELKKERLLYDLVKDAGEIIHGSLHIIDCTPFRVYNIEEGKFRVYHEGGYCFDIEKEYVCEPEDVNGFENVEFDGYAYTFFCEWPGFGKLTVEGAIDIIKLSL